MNIRQYKKRYLICKDDFGENIYVGDIVELYCPIEMHTSWQSVVYWSMLHGAWVDSHPTHINMGIGSQRTLYNLLEQEEYTIYYDGEDEPRKMKGYCKKVKSFYKK